MIAALLILTVAAADAVIGLFELARAPQRTTSAVRVMTARDIAGISLGCSAAAAVAVGSWLALGVPMHLAAVMLLFALAWVGAGQVFAMTGRTAPLLVATVILIATTALGATISVGVSFDGPALSAFTRWTAAVGAPVSPALVVGVVAVALALTRTSNLICRAALGRTLAADAPRQSPPPGHRWAVMVGRRRFATVVDAPALAHEPDPSNEVDARPTGLKGGRVIGPLERILIVSLGLVGSQALIVGLLAAKGIVRFPEISADNRHGSKAEEFLVGSLVSWTLAGLSVALLSWLRNG